MTKDINLPWRLKPPFQQITSNEEFIEIVKNPMVVGYLYQPDILKPTELHSTIRVDNVTFENVSFAKTELRRLRFRKCTFVECLFIGTKFSECDFYHCQFSLCNFHKIRISETSFDPNLICGCIDQKQHTNIALHLYSELRKSALQIENPEFAREAGYQYNRWNRFHLIYKFKSKEIRLLEFILRWIANITLDWVLGYGWRIRRFAVSSAMLLACLTAWNYYFWHNLTGDETIAKSPSIIKSLYFTVITITTLGYGDLTPATAMGMIFASTQTILGVIWIGMLVSVVVRKVLP